MPRKEDQVQPWKSERKFPVRFNRLVVNGEYRKQVFAITDAETLKEYLQVTYPKAFHLIYVASIQVLKQCGISAAENTRLQLHIENNSYPFDLETKVHGKITFANMDQLGSFFTKLAVDRKKKKT